MKPSRAIRQRRGTVKFVIAERAIIEVYYLQYGVGCSLYIGHDEYFRIDLGRDAHWHHRPMGINRLTPIPQTTLVKQLEVAGEIMKAHGIRKEFIATILEQLLKKDEERRGSSHKISAGKSKPAQDMAVPPGGVPQAEAYIPPVANRT